MNRRTLLLIAAAFLCQFTIGQEINEAKAKRAVQKYIKAHLSKSDVYTSVKFHEIFLQPEPASLKTSNECTGEVIYTVSHSYLVNEYLIEFDYFHLNSKYKIVCASTAEDMLDDDIFSADAVTRVLDKLESEEGEAIDTVLTHKTIEHIEIESPEVSFYLNYRFEEDSDGTIVNPILNSGNFRIVFPRQFLLDYLSARFMENKVMHSPGSSAKEISVKLYHSLSENKLDKIDLSTEARIVLKSDSGYDKKDFYTFQQMIIESFYRKLFESGDFNIEHIDNLEVTEVSKKTSVIEYADFIRTITEFYARVGGEEIMVKKFINSDYVTK